METVNIGLIGFGTIGSGVVATLNQNLALIEDKVQKKVVLKKVVDLDIKTDRGVKIKPQLLSTDVNDILHDPEIDIVIELIGGYQPALKFIKTAMNNGKHVVTANKALLAKYWPEIIDSSIDNQVRICFEASVGGGIPLLKPLNECLASNHIQSIYGIINGTANYILSKMAKEELDFYSVLKDAQEKGYAEQDPTFDIEGLDSAQKLIILTVLGFGVYIEPDKIHVEGISHITSEDIKFAQENMDCCIKLLAIAKKEDDQLEVRVHPTLIPNDHLLSSVNDVFNGVYIEGDIVGPIMMYGQGAGMMPTASAVVGDCIDLINNMNAKVDYGPKNPTISGFKKIEDTSFKYYLRLTAMDKPGVLHQISGILSELDISIESVIQKQGRSEEEVPIFMVTHEAQERKMRKALKSIRELDFILEEPVLLRLL